MAGILTYVFSMAGICSRHPLLEPYAFPYLSTVLTRSGAWLGCLRSRHYSAGSWEGMGLHKGSRRAPSIVLKLCSLGPHPEPSSWEGCGLRTHCLYPPPEPQASPSQQGCPWCHIQCEAGTGRHRGKSICTTHPEK